MCMLCVVNATTGEERPDLDSVPAVPVTQEFLESYTILLYQGIITEKVLSTELYNSVGNYLNAALDGGYKLNFDGGSDADKLYRELRHNIWHFAAAKQYSQNREILRNFIPAGQRSFIAPAEVVPFDKFKKTADGILANYNSNYLKTEYVTSVANAQSARDWNNMITDDTVQMIRYRTQRDGRVRPGHQAIDGTTKHKEDAFWNTHYPPNGWHCRCFVLDMGSYAKEKTPDTIPQHGTDPDFPKMFKMNPGKDRLIFPNAHPYFRIAHGDGAFREANYGLPITDVI